MSIANAIRVIKAAVKARNDENRTIVICDERDNRRASKVAPVAENSVKRETHQWSGHEVNGLDRGTENRREEGHTKWMHS